MPTSRILANYSKHLIAEQGTEEDKSWGDGMGTSIGTALRKVWRLGLRHSPGRAVPYCLNAGPIWGRERILLSRSHTPIFFALVVFCMCVPVCDGQVNVLTYHN